MKTYYTLFLIVFSVCWTSIKAQDTLVNPAPNKRLAEDQLVAGKQYVIDTIINGRAYFKEAVKQPETTTPQTVDAQTTALQSTPIVPAITERDSLQDDAFSASIDQKWLDELYSTNLYDTIYKTVSELKYDDVYYPELDTETLKQRLAEIDARTPFNVEYNKSLESVIKMFLKTRKNYYERMIGLSHYYFPMFEKELDNQNIPLEIKYLSIVESALKPRARSRVGATGLWQFMYPTGKQYGLDVSSYVDERSDPIKSTKSAATYLAKLYEIFGDWDLALAAYNSGPGNVSKAIRRSGGYKNYWNIRHNLPRETAGYVPAFLATMYIFEYAEEHGLKPQKPMFDHIQTDTIRVKQMIALDHVSEMTGVKMEELQFLNPSYKLDIIPKVKGKSYYLRLPREAVGKFVNNEAKIYAFSKAEFNKREKPLPQFSNADAKTRYRVKQGDYLGKIARKFGVRVSQIKRWNGLRSNNLKIGQRLVIYPRNPSGQVAKPKPKPKVIPAHVKTYTVKNGDSLWSISQQFDGVTVSDLKQWNNIRGNNLKIGMKLVVSKP